MELIEELDKRAISEKVIKIAYDPDTGFLGTKVTGAHTFECSNLDKLLLFFDDGTYRVISIPEKQYIHTKEARVIWLGVADKKTVMSIIYTDEKGYPHAKRFVVKQYILEKEYEFLDRSQQLEYISSQAGETLKVQFKPKPKQKVTSIDFSFDEVGIKGVAAKGIRIANKELKSISVKK